MSAMLITNVSVFDGTGSPSVPGEVLIVGKRIAAVARGGEHIDPQGAEVLDGAGGTLMPGLIEPHSHLTFPSSIDRKVPGMMPPPERHSYITAHNAKTILDYGYTSAFSGGATRPQIEVALRDEIAAGYLPGPRLKAASFEHQLDGSRGIGSGVEDVEKFCREMISVGVDSMKFVLSAPGSIDPKRFNDMPYDDAQIAAAARIAHEQGINLLGHAYSSESIQLAIRHGFRAIYHCNFADEPTLDLMEEHKDEYWVVPAVGVIEAGLTRTDELAPDARERSEESQEGLRIIDEGQRRVIPEMRKRGIRVLPGGDYGFVYNPHGRNAWEFELFQHKFGFEPAEILAAATRGGAGIMGMADELGQIKPGYLADLLVIDGDPLSDVTLLQDKDNLRIIMQEGKFYKRSSPRL
jgi:imidazolonepropionase-like amidohydrolase